MTEAVELKLKPIAIRWGYTGMQFACGPVEGDTVTEVTFLDCGGKPKFVSVTRMENFANAYVSNVPLYELLYYMADSAVDTQYVMDLVEDTSEDFKSLELPDLSYLDGSEYEAEYLLALMANDYRYNHENDMSAEDWLNAFQRGEITDWESEMFFED